MKQTPSDLTIISCLNTHYGIQVTRLKPMPIGADMNAFIYKVQATDQTAYFIKLKSGHSSDIAVEIVELLQIAKVQLVIPPIKTLNGRQTVRIEGFTLIVYPFIEGQDGFSRKLTDDQWVQLGKALRQVHELEVPLLFQSQIRKESYSPKWRKSLLSLYAQMEDEPIGDEIALKLHQFMKSKRLEICRMADRAEMLAQKVQKQMPKSVLCHSDIHAGNILIDGNNSIYIVDWDEPVMAPKERDLMFIGAGVGNVWNNPREEKLFYLGYGKTEVNPEILTYYRYERIVEDIALYGQELLITMSKSVDRPLMYRHFMDMFEPRGVVDIAFKTDGHLDV